MEERVVKLVAIAKSRKFGEIEGVIIPSRLAKEILKRVSFVDLAVCDMRTICRIAQQ